MKWLSSKFRNADRARTPKPSTGLPEPIPDRYPSGIKLLYNPEADALVDIVFVHGLTGNRDKTWTAHGATEPWPKTLLPSEIPDARILTFGYDADVVNLKGVVSANRIANHSWKLLTDLARVRENGETNARPIIFVCHSLGGLVCEDALVTSKHRPNGHLQAIVNSTRGIAFLGTPHHGAGLAVWADHFLKWISVFKQTNKSIVKTLRRDSEVLARIQDSFHTIIQSRNRDTNTSIDITCFFEELPISGVGLVVPQDSAVLPGYIPIGIHSNHQDMARFASGDDPGFKSVCAELQRWIKRLRRRRSEAAPADLSQRLDMTTEENSVELQARQDGHFMVRVHKNCNFVGRSEILDRLKEEFGHGERCKVFGGRSRACLYGLGGIGKTQIALQYVYWLRETRPDFSIFWVHASSEARFRQSFEDIAEECDIPGRHSPSVNILPFVQTWLQESYRHPWLMVLDNADDAFLFYPKSQTATGGFAIKYEDGSGQRGLGHFMPESDCSCLLVTTRNKQAGLELVFGQPIIEVERMGDEESAQMISIMTGVKDLPFSKSAALSNRLENLPLALAQASAFISRNSITVDRYLELLDESDRHFMSLLCQDFTALGRDSEIPPAVMLTWVVSFEQIDLQYPLASELLSLMAFFDCHAVPRYFLSTYFSGSYLKLLNFQELPELTGIGEFDDEGDQSDAETGPTAAYETQTAIEASSHTDLGANGLLRHLQTMVAIQVSQSTTEEIEENHQSPADWYTSPNSGTSGTTSYSDSQDTSTTPTSEEAPNREGVDSVEIEKALGVLKAFSFIRETNDHHFDMHRLVQLATKKWLVGKGSSRDSASKALGTISRVFPGVTYENVEICKKLLPHAHAVLSNQFDESYQNALSLALLLSNLSTLFLNTGQISFAIKASRRALISTRNRLGATHPMLLKVMRRLAEALSAQGYQTQSREMLRNVAALQLKVYPGDHPEILHSIRMMAKGYRSTGRFEEARDLLDLALRQCNNSKHQKTSTIKVKLMLEIGMHLMRTGQLGKAEAQFTQTEAEIKRIFGSEGPLSLQNIWLLCQVMRRQGQAQKAETICRQTLENRNISSDNAKIHLVAILSVLGLVLHDQGKYEAAADAHIEVLEIATRIYGRSHPAMLSFMNALVMTREAQNRLEEAELWKSEVLELSATLFESTHPTVLRDMHHLTTLRRKMNQHDRSGQLAAIANEPHTQPLTYDELRSMCYRTEEVDGVECEGNLHIRSGMYVDHAAENITPVWHSFITTAEPYSGGDSSRPIRTADLPNL